MFLTGVTTPNIPNLGREVLVLGIRFLILGRVKKKHVSRPGFFQKKEEEGLFIFYFLFQDGRHSLLKCQISIVFSTAEIHKTKMKQFSRGIQTRHSDCFC